MAIRPRGVVLATPALADDLARRLAPEHIREVAELSRVAPEEAIRLSLAVSREAYAVTAPAGAVLFMMGVESPGCLTSTALVWMLAAPEARLYPRRLLRAAGWGLGRAFYITGAAALEQYIPAWYTTGLRFVRRLGFRVHAGTDAGIRRVTLEQHVFFEKERSNPWDQR